MSLVTTVWVPGVSKEDTLTSTMLNVSLSCMNSCAHPCSALPCLFIDVSPGELGHAHRKKAKDSDNVATFTHKAHRSKQGRVQWKHLRLLELEELPPRLLWSKSLSLMSMIHRMMHTM